MMVDAADVEFGWGAPTGPVGIGRPACAACACAFASFLSSFCVMWYEDMCRGGVGICSVDRHMGRGSSRSLGSEVVPGSWGRIRTLLFRSSFACADSATSTLMFHCICFVVIGVEPHIEKMSKRNETRDGIAHPAETLWTDSKSFSSSSLVKLRYPYFLFRWNHD